MVIQAEATTPSAILDRASLLLDAFDGPGRLTLAQIVRRTGLPPVSYKQQTLPTKREVY
ncbi:helix-turn-helix domain-containing protein, partial [Nocardia sp. NPDC058497]|uniref:helix-turn-helix domain-containing protein n=1 Tax=Nocardia sp. NPDC058497 TaxID=3346529 RepID=UPI00364680CD